MHAVNPSSRVSNAAKIVRETAAILLTIDAKSRNRILTLLTMSKARYRGMSLQKALSYRRLPSNRVMFGE